VKVKGYLHDISVEAEAWATSFLGQSAFEGTPTEGFSQDPQTRM
jgi:hypothetical protein